ncbi:protein phosphatase CheZ [Colwellia sp. MB02u-6]|jgi:chemotaxis protein CheZ|uniref:protein phosphatase CheZ n=1 Tax=Colwellia sp. MB02u-6 TaxID=2759824 RepID=UPI0015F4A3E0|nr:protein phosphatase CheZ [Colwellia sp. MB02u-6]MBA6326985.1 protein phosphatase CheZ [Colwellia sp. MB02u-6]
MSKYTSIHVSLEQAKLLVKYLEADQQNKADELIAEIQNPIQTALFEEIGKLTRELHNSLNNFHFDSRLNDLATADIPDAKERLNFVIDRTEEAANKTMDVVESIFPVVSNIQQQINNVNPQWHKLMHNELDVAEFKTLCRDIDVLLTTTAKETSKIHGLMTDVLMAQDFQDLTGQIIRKVIDLVCEVEDSLITMLTAFGISSKQEQSNHHSKLGENLVEGPIVNPGNRKDVVSDQHDVDDLLSSLGF